MELAIEKEKIKKRPDENFITNTINILICNEAEIVEGCNSWLFTVLRIDESKLLGFNCSTLEFSKKQVKLN